MVLSEPVYGTLTITVDWFKYSNTSASCIPVPATEIVVAPSLNEPLCTSK